MHFHTHVYTHRGGKIIILSSSARSKKKNYVLPPLSLPPSLPLSLNFYPIMDTVTDSGSPSLGLKISRPPCDHQFNLGCGHRRCLKKKECASCCDVSRQKI